MGGHRIKHMLLVYVLAHLPKGSFEGTPLKRLRSGSLVLTQRMRLERRPGPGVSRSFKGVPGHRFLEALMFLFVFFFFFVFRKKCEVFGNLSQVMVSFGFILEVRLS